MKIKYKVEINLKKPIRLLLGNSFDETNSISQECYSKQEAKTFIKQWLKEPYTVDVSLWKLKKHWGDK